MHFEFSEVYQEKRRSIRIEGKLLNKNWQCPWVSHEIRKNIVLLKEADYIMNKSWSRIFALTMGIPLLLAILAACGSGTTSGSSSTTPTATGSTTIKVATDFPTSGKEATSGKPAENGAALAVNQANTNHTIQGYTLVFVPKDDVGPSGIHDPTVGAANVTALISDALVAGIVGPFNSNVAKAEMPIANQAPIAQISPANTNTCLTQNTAASGCTGANNLIPTLRPTGKVNYFRIATTDSHQGPAGADYLYKTKGYKTVYVIDDAETYGIGIANSFSQEWTTIGGTVLGRSSEPGTTTSYVSLLTQIATKSPDVIYFGGLNSTGGDLIRQQMLQVPGLQNTPLGGGDGIVTSDFASAVPTGKGGPAFGTVATTDVANAPGGQAFIQQYNAIYGAANFGAYSAAAYDSMNILIQSIKAALANGAHTPQNSSDTAGAATFRAAVIAAIQGIAFTGVLGQQSFDMNGDTTNKVITIYQVGPAKPGVFVSTPGWNPEAAVTIP
jgi:branched-chain amino acid transport system substrate-binding protein